VIIPRLQIVTFIEAGGEQGCGRIGTVSPEEQDRASRLGGILLVKHIRKIGMFAVSKEPQRNHFPIFVCLQ
jgi:hypothetical protein